MAAMGTPLCLRHLPPQGDWERGIEFAASPPLSRRRGELDSHYLPRKGGGKRPALLGGEDWFASDDSGGLHFLEVSGAETEVVAEDFLRVLTEQWGSDERDVAL